MNKFFHYAKKGTRVRCRQEDDDNFLLYHPETDELHMVSRDGKAIFDMCDGRSIDDLVVEGAKLLQPNRETPEESEPFRGEVLSYLCALQKRALIELT
tara:strand:- start:9301 stop:9594 length:294 start_codon:yes stop_codon:yes gene_type:complete